MTPTHAPVLTHLAQAGIPLSEASILQIIAIVGGAIIAATGALALFVRSTLLQIAKSQGADIEQRKADLKQRELDAATALQMRISDHDQLAEAARIGQVQIKRLEERQDRMQAENDALHEQQLQTMRDHASLMHDFGSLQAELSAERRARAEDKAAYEARIVAKDARFAADIASMKVENATAIADVKRESDKDVLRMQARMDDMVRSNAIDSAASKQRIAVLESQAAGTQAVSDRRGESITRNVEQASRDAGGGKAGQAVIDAAIGKAAPGDPPPPPSHSEKSTTGDPANK